VRGGEAVAVDAAVKLAGGLGDGRAQIGVQVSAGRGQLHPAGIAGGPRGSDQQTRPAATS